MKEFVRKYAPIKKDTIHLSAEAHQPYKPRLLTSGHETSQRSQRSRKRRLTRLVSPDDEAASAER